MCVWRSLEERAMDGLIDVGFEKRGRPCFISVLSSAAFLSSCWSGMQSVLKLAYGNLCKTCSRVAYAVQMLMHLPQPLSRQADLAQSALGKLWSAQSSAREFAHELAAANVGLRSYEPRPFHPAP